MVTAEPSAKHKALVSVGPWAQGTMPMRPAALITGAGWPKVQPLGLRVAALFLWESEV